MSVIGPRPQLVRDLVFMSKEERKRHTVKPGLSGLAQVKGRNAISWEEKFKWDLQYVENISFFQDMWFCLSRRRGMSVCAGGSGAAAGTCGSGI